MARWQRGATSCHSQPFLRRQRTPLPRSQIFRQSQPADALPMQCGDEAADTAKHALDLMMAAFMQGHAGTAFAEDHEFGGQGGDVFSSEVEATLEGGNGIAWDRRIGFDKIGLGHF